MSAVNNLSASKEIHHLAHEHGLVDVYADSPGSRFGEYVDCKGCVVCRVYDVDPAADLIALRAAIALSKAEGHIGQELAPDPERRVNGNANGDEE